MDAAELVLQLVMLGVLLELRLPLLMLLPPPPLAVYATVVGKMSPEGEEEEEEKLISKQVQHTARHTVSDTLKCTCVTN